MVYMNRLNFKLAQFKLLTWLYYIELRVFKNLMLFEFTFDKTNRQLCRVNGNLYGFEKERKSSDMVLMSVCNENTFELVGVALDICEIGNDKVNAEHIAVWERETAVYDDNIIIVLYESHVFSYFVKSAEKSDFNGLTLFGCRFLSRGTAF